MIVSEQWLRELVSPSVDMQQLADKLTMLGLEVDGVEPAAPEFSGVVVGEVLSIEAHPDADKLRVCQVQGSDGVVQVVCGANNVDKGVKIPFAEVGAVLPGNFKIKKAKLRGVESFGMLCADSELGLAEQSSGLWLLPNDAPVGQCVRQYLKLDDALIDVDLTPNRGDCFSMLGIAREVATAYQLPLSSVSEAVVEVSKLDTPNVILANPEHCAKYCGRVVRGVDFSQSTPLWMVERLRRAGIRSLNVAVDVTNYVMLELGQPMHAFDLAQINGDITVRLANKGESLVLLDGSEVNLTENTLLIADEQKPLAMAGVMGGLDSAVTDATQDVFLESAFFAPNKIIGRARSYGLHTDSSHRFERGVDWQLQVCALERATQLLIELAGGQAGEIQTVIDNAHLPILPVIPLRQQRIERVLGLSLDTAVIESNLNALGMTVVPTEQGWDVTPPSYRFDMAIESDLIEEVVRLYGYDQLPYTRHQGGSGHKTVSETHVDLMHYKRALVSRGYQEAICYSFISPELQSAFDISTPAIVLSNPISSELSIMRTSLIPGLIATLQYNLNRQQKRVKLFETGLRFVPQSEGDLKQESVIAGLICGDVFETAWNVSARAADFYDVKGDVEVLLSTVGVSHFEFKTSQHGSFHPGQSADVYKGGRLVGTVGALHPQVLKRLKLKSNPFVFELLSDELNVAELPKAAPLSEFPATRRDLALLVERSVNASEIVKCIKQAAPAQLQSVSVFDVYQGENLKDNLKSIALGLILQDFSSTLDDTEVDVIVQKVLNALRSELNAVLRD